MKVPMEGSRLELVRRMNTRPNLAIRAGCSVLNTNYVTVE
jgi:hypothetical protein